MLRTENSVRSVFSTILLLTKGLKVGTASLNFFTLLICGNPLIGSIGYSIYLLTQVMGWKPEQVHLLVARVRKELRSKKVHPNIQVEVIYGRKPENV